MEGKISQKNRTVICAAGIMIIVFFMLSMILQVVPDRFAGAAFCHQLQSRSPAYGFPFCYRCSGLFSGILGGILFSLISRKGKKLFSVPLLCGTAAAFLLFLTDIINTTEFIPVHWYEEREDLRFLSAYPLGFMLVCIIAPVFFALTEKDIRPGPLRREMLLPGLVIGAGISYLFIFSGSKIMLTAFRFPAALAAVIFLWVLYYILTKCIFILRSKTCPDLTAAAAAVILALVQICLFGSVHLLFLPFDSLL